MKELNCLREHARKCRQCLRLEEKPFDSDKASDSDGTSWEIWLSFEFLWETSIISNRATLKALETEIPMLPSDDWRKYPKFIVNYVDTIVPSPKDVPHDLFAPPILFRVSSKE